jgi:hypothetical protein
MLVKAIVTPDTITKRKKQNAPVDGRAAMDPLRYRLPRLTPQPPGNVRWRSIRGPRRNVSAPPDKPTVTGIVLSD